MRLKKLNPLNFYYILCNILTKFLINDVIYKVSASNKIYCRSASGANATMCNKYTLNHFEYFKNRDLSHSLDYLTSILNREALVQYLAWLIKEGKPFSFFIVDIDNFKNINDTYGHQVAIRSLLKWRAISLKWRITRAWLQGTAATNLLWCSRA